MFDNPIFFLILLSLLATAAEWIGKRRKSRQADAAAEEENVDEEKTSSRRRNLREKQQQWEERLRRLLEGEVGPIPAESKPPEPPPRPVDPPKTPLKEQTRLPVKEVPIRPSFQPRARSTAVSQKISRSSGKDQKPRRELRQLPISLSRRFRNRQAVRQAVIASVVFGPSKGTEENSDLLRF